MEKIRPREDSGSGAIVTFFFSTTDSGPGTDGGGGMVSLPFCSASLSNVEGGRGQGTVSLVPELNEFWGADGAPG